MSTEYWNESGPSKTFGNPLELSWLEPLGSEAAVLDYGCGYGRLVGELRAAGFADVEGVDISAALIERARREHPGARFTVLAEPPRLDRDDASVDAVLLFAVLTCIPDDEAQRGVLDEIRRVLKPGGLLYLSDYCLQDDERNVARYREHETRFGVHGVFETSDGAVCRHHEREWLRGLLSGFEVLRERDVPVTTMNGNPAVATQFLARRD
ncbi:class I SAM-dependent methyltransferase [Catenulispora subtropica]|uniref:Methyltransferase type 11 domain-containing protein n=1 Tax=Catenulispora subtropica TaxID=450798 RepID=A0ABN2QNI8_9ACTN